MSKFFGYWFLHGTGLLDLHTQNTETPEFSFERPQKIEDKQDSSPFRSFRHGRRRLPHQR